MLRLQIRGEKFDASFRDGAGSLAAMVLLDELTPDRLSALARFWAALAGKTVPPDPRITRSRQKRAREMLRVLDGRASGATYRAIADAVFPKHDHDAASWVGSAIRETTIRLARDGAKLVHGGYRSILRRPRRDR
ncbi:DNA -binding domain-containing protein [Sphingobium yanoikuyae]